MPWALLLDWRVWAAGAFAALGIYAAVQHMGWQAAEARYVTLEAETTKLAVETKVKNAQESARQARNAQEALDGLQTRLNRSRALYASLRANPGGGGVPAAGASTAIPSPISRSPIEPDPDARCLAALEWGDIELAKYAELWRLQEVNAAD